MTVWGACGRWFESSHPDNKMVLQMLVEPFLFFFNTFFNTFCAITAQEVM